MSNFNNNPYLAHIFIYPIKSLDGIWIPQSTILDSGALTYDRQWAIFDDNDRFVNGKRNNKIYQLRTSFNTQVTQVFLQVEGSKEKIEFNLQTERKEIEVFLSDFLGFSVHLKENKITGFPDDTNASGPTIISTATIEAIANWFPNIEFAEIRRRLRANLEINGVPAFWEDQLFANQNQWVNFRIGQINFQGINPCQRCIVPTKNSQTGEVTNNFQSQFITKRKDTLPPWVNPSQFNHFYRVSVNTKIVDSALDKVLKVGDKIEIIGVG
ncbi:MOSC domain-containing protein [Aphanothece sacrum]|uniref:Fe-S protein n=1 Tax=Aphanothece sacrum FPU1 TaxID=1920663 RepID=A0A401IDK1_APHSA|nr:MOSC N-terminal beta barrel domain-containing protein [Aphanothece sacrum]GBF79332.1 Fe-S protein [Aphanothece sacrum FPU1]GBF86834.1 Fe-S protein [Aphanothece sacrum FPU3]